MEKTREPMEVFAEEAPEVSKAFNVFIQALSGTKGLNDKARQLIYIAIKASQGDTAAVAMHVPMARHAGASRDEVRDAILLTLAVTGITGVATCLPVAMDIFDEAI
jgi:alkylhydroperoxidase/carboxymuconolactone decarboxylase family protein YurZ